MKIYTVDEVAKKLCTNKNYIYNLKKARLLRFMKLGKLKVREEDVTDPFNVVDLNND